MGIFYANLKLKPKRDQGLSRMRRWYNPEECDGFRMTSFDPLIVGMGNLNPNMQT
jgi:hypothetical protein